MRGSCSSASSRRPADREQKVRAVEEGERRRERKGGEREREGELARATADNNSFASADP